MNQTTANNQGHVRKDVALVVDDSLDTLSLLNDILDGAGITVLVALEGQQALTITENVTPDIILMDAVMPNMDGFETCKKIKKQHTLAHVPVIFMTGLSDTENVVKGLEAGGVDYITKPIKTDELLVRMRVHLNNARLTMNAQDALDGTGHYLFSVNEKALPLWSTPQAQQLFESAGADEQYRQEQFVNTLLPLINGSLPKNTSLCLDDLSKNLTITYVSQTKDGEFLLRVSEASKESGTERLITQFKLTKREADVLLWLGQGKTNQEIGAILSMSPRTVNKHLEMIFRKLNVENRTTAAIKASKCLDQVH